MTNIDRIYENVDDFGLITSAEAAKIGVPNAQLVQMARRGKLVRMARGVYRMPIWPSQEAAPYAIAVKSAGPSAFLWGESVVALLGLAPTDPSKMWIACPTRTRRDLGPGTTVVTAKPDSPVTWYEGMRCQPVADAVVAAAATLGPARAEGAAEEAARQGYISEGALDAIKEAIGR